MNRKLPRPRTPPRGTLDPASTSLEARLRAVEQALALPDVAPAASSSPAQPAAADADLARQLARANYRILHLERSVRELLAERAARSNVVA